MDKNERLNYSIKELKELSIFLGRQPTSTEYDKNVKFGYKRRQIQRNFGLSWNDFCKIYNSGYGFNNYHYKNKDDILDKIIKFYENIDYVPTYQDIRKNNLPDYKVIKKFFGMTYKELLKELGYVMKGSTTYSKTDKEMIEDFKKYYEKTGMLISSNHNAEGLKCYETYITRFGSIKNVCDMCGINYDLSNKNNGSFGSYHLDNNGNICNSCVEKEISNYFINNGIKFEKEYPYKNLIKGCRFVFDWRIEINNKFYYVEYAGLYDKNSKNKNIIKYSKKIEDKISILKENNIIDSCIFIYPKDYKNKTLEEIFCKIINPA